MFGRDISVDCCSDSDYILSFIYLAEATLIEFLLVDSFLNLNSSHNCIMYTLYFLLCYLFQYLFVLSFKNLKHIDCSIHLVVPIVVQKTRLIASYPSSLLNYLDLAMFQVIIFSRFRSI